MSNNPAFKTKFFFWIILGLFSVFFAEVVSGSYIFPYFTLWGFFAIIPLYTLHTLILASLVFNYGKPNLYTLFSAGILFGLYEAYITKVLWVPSWGPAIYTFLGIAVVETIVLVLFWHVFMSFIIPLIVAEGLLTKSSSVIGSMPQKARNLFKNKALRVMFVLAAVFGMVQSANPSAPQTLFLSGISTTGVLMFFTFLWKRKERKHTLKELLPNTH